MKKKDALPLKFLPPEIFKRSRQGIAKGSPALKLSQGFYSLKRGVSSLVIFSMLMGDIAWAMREEEEETRPISSPRAKPKPASGDQDSSKKGKILSPIDLYYGDDDISEYISASISQSPLFQHAEGASYLLTNEKGKRLPIRDKEDGRLYFVASTPAIDTLGKSYQVRGVSSTNLEYFFDKSTHPQDLREEILEKLIRFKPSDMNNAYGEFLQRLEDLKKTGQRFEFIDDILAQPDVGEDLGNIQARLNKELKEIQNSKKDLFDELMPFLVSLGSANTKILFPYNRTLAHWLTGEIRIYKEGKKYRIEVYSHDPYGKGRMEKPSYDGLIKAIEKRISEFQSDAEYTFKNMESPYDRRQDPDDGISCGVITAEHILQRITGESSHLYPLGVKDLRRSHLKVVSKGNPKAAFMIRNNPKVNFIHEHEAFLGDLTTLFAKLLNSPRPYFAEESKTPEAKGASTAYVPKHKPETRFVPLVAFSPEEAFFISPVFRGIFHDVLQLLLMSYQIADTPNSEETINLKDWEKKVFKGTTGEHFIDKPGVVAYNKKKNIIAIIFRGSNCNADWLTNSYFLPEKFSLLDELPIHRGFLNRYRACKESMEAAISDFWDRLTPQRRSSLQFITSGHSLGAGMASIAIVDLVRSYLNSKYGPEYNNEKSNRLYAYLLSPPSIAIPEKFLEDHKEGTEAQIVNVVNRIVGKDNIISHSVLYDLVTRVGFDKLAESLPLSDKWAKQIKLMAGRIVLGHLAIQDPISTFIEGMNKSIAATLNMVERGHAGSVVQILFKLLEIPQIITGKLFTKLKGAFDIVVAGTGTRGWTPYQIVCLMQGPLHFGSTINGKGWDFDPGLVKDVREGLIRAYFYQKNEALPLELLSTIDPYIKRTLVSKLNKDIQKREVVTESPAKLNHLDNFTKLHLEKTLTNNDIRERLTHTGAKYSNSLTTLDFSEIQLLAEPSTVSAIANCINSCSQLTELNLGGCILGYNFSSELGEAILKRKSTLKYLSLGGFWAVSEFLGNMINELKNLKWLNLFHISLPDDQLLNLAHALRNHYSIESLYIKLPYGESHASREANKGLQLVFDKIVPYGVGVSHVYFYVKLGCFIYTGGAAGGASLLADWLFATKGSLGSALITPIAGNVFGRVKGWFYDYRQKVHSGLSAATASLAHIPKLKQLHVSGITEEYVKEKFIEAFNTTREELKLDPKVDKQIMPAQ